MTTSTIANLTRFIHTLAICVTIHMLYIDKFTHAFGVGGRRDTSSGERNIAKQTCAASPVKAFEKTKKIALALKACAGYLLYLCMETGEKNVSLFS